MLHYAVVFFIIAIIAAVLALGVLRPGPHPLPRSCLLSLLCWPFCRWCLAADSSRAVMVA